MLKTPPNTHTDEELMSPEFRAGVDVLKMAIRITAIAKAISTSAPTGRRSTSLPGRFSSPTRARNRQRCTGRSS